MTITSTLKSRPVRLRNGILPIPEITLGHDYCFDCVTFNRESTPIMNAL